MNQARSRCSWEFVQKPWDNEAYSVPRFCKRGKLRWRDDYGTLWPVFHQSGRHLAPGCFLFPVSPDAGWTKHHRSLSVLLLPNFVGCVVQHQLVKERRSSGRNIENGDDRGSLHTIEIEFLGNRKLMKDRIKKGQWWAVRVSATLK